MLISEKQIKYKIKSQSFSFTDIANLKSQILLKMFKELLATGKEMIILPRLSKNGEWLSMTLGLNKRMKVLCQDVRL